MADLTPEEQDFLLQLVDEPGADTDFHDGDDVLGWPSWSIEGDILSVNFRPDNEDADEPRPNLTGRWRLIYLDGESGGSDD